MSRQTKQGNASILTRLANFERQVSGVLSILGSMLYRLAFCGLSMYGLYRLVLLALKQG